MIQVVKMLGEYRLQCGSEFVGCDHPGSDARLVMAEEVIEQLPEHYQPERDTLGFVFTSHNAATLTLAQVVNRLWKDRL